MPHFGEAGVGVGDATQAKQDAIEAKLDVPANFMADVTALALEATLAVVDGIVDAILADTATINWADITAIDAIVDAIKLKTDTIVWGDITTIDTVVDAIKAKTDILPAANFDETDDFNWDTSAYTTDETDISALFSTPLTGATRRAYSLFLDLTTAEADAAEWTECTIRVKVKIDAANYRTVDLKVIAKTDVAATAEPGINIDIPPAAQDVQVTMQFDVALTGDATIPYHYVREALE